MKAPPLHYPGIKTPRLPLRYPPPVGAVNASSCLSWGNPEVSQLVGLLETLLETEMLAEAGFVIWERGVFYTNFSITASGFLMFPVNTTLHRQSGFLFNLFCCFFRVLAHYPVYNLRTFGLSPSLPLVSLSKLFFPLPATVRASVFIA